MENATKALEMAASVLIGMLILGMLVFAYTQFSEVKQIEQDGITQKQAADFNQNFESYNRDVYGSELFSLVNQMVNYNKKEAEEKGYTRIEMSVKLKNTTGFQVFTKSQYNSSELNSYYNNLNNQISNANETVKGKKISYWASAPSELRATFSTTTRPTLDTMIKDIETYNQYVTEQEDMARKTFKCTEVQYDSNNGRITLMKYQEK